MHLDAAITEFFYSKDFTTDSARFYRRALAAFQAWLQDQGIGEVEDITPPLLLLLGAACMRETPRGVRGWRLACGDMAGHALEWKEWKGGHRSSASHNGVKNGVKNPVASRACAKGAVQRALWSSCPHASPVIPTSSCASCANCARTVRELCRWGARLCGGCDADVPR